MASHPPPLASKADVSLDVRRAAECDAAGAHREAIDHLVAGTRKKDLEATTQLGKRLLVGDRAPCLPKDGAGLLAEASAAGGAEAAAVLAVLYAVGAGAGRDLDAAVESLVVAAERGWVPAQRQLAVLAARDGSADSSRHALGSRIDLDVWRAAPAATALCASPTVRAYPEFLTTPVCDWLIERARGRLSRALVYEAISREVTVRPSRTNTAASFNLLDTDLVLVLVQRKMAACLGMPIRQFEACTVLHYEANEEITEHYDFIDPKVPNYAEEIAQRGERLVTFLLYLNDDYAAGETAFPRLGISHKGRRGEGLFFVNALPDGTPDVRTLHAGRRPERGEKWIVSQFVRNRAVL